MKDKNLLIVNQITVGYFNQSNQLTHPFRFVELRRPALLGSLPLTSVIFMMAANEDLSAKVF